MKKLGAVICSIALIGVFCAPASAAVGARPRIYDVSEAAAWEDAQSYGDEHAAFGDGSGTGPLSDLEVGAGEEVRIYLHAGLFADANGKALPESGVSLSQLRTGGVTVSPKVARGEAVVKEISLEYERNPPFLKLPAGNGTSCIKIVFAEDFISEEDVFFDITVRLKVQGKAIEKTEIQVTGYLRNRIVEVDSTTGYLELGAGVIARAESAVKDCVVDLGNGFQITANLRAGERYYGVARIEAADSELLLQYPEIELIYNIHQQNLDSGKNPCRIQDQPVLYVYDSAGKYLGSTEDALPLSQRYYLASEKLKSLDKVVSPPAG